MSQIDTNINQEKPTDWEDEMVLYSKCMKKNKNTYGTQGT